MGYLKKGRLSWYLAKIEGNDEDYREKIEKIKIEKG